MLAERSIALEEEVPDVYTPGDMNTRGRGRLRYSVRRIVVRVVVCTT